jgi:hypothetical protein
MPASRRGWAMLALVMGALLPVAVPGEVVRLKDGSTLKGRLVRVEGDTLAIRLDLGSTVKVPRSLIESIVFADSIAADPLRPAAGAVVAPQSVPAGVGSIEVIFEDRKVSTKITIDKKKNWDAKVLSNNIVLEFIVDGVVAYSAVDTTTDKTIYLGHEMQLKNDAEFADFTVEVPSGPRRCSIVLRNRDPERSRRFRPRALNSVLKLDEMLVRPGGSCASVYTSTREVGDANQSSG